jgi:hypothetical protein
MIPHWPDDFIALQRVLESLCRFGFDSLPMQGTILSTGFGIDPILNPVRRNCKTCGDRPRHLAERVKL